MSDTATIETQETEAAESVDNQPETTETQDDIVRLDSLQEDDIASLSDEDLEKLQNETVEEQEEPETEKSTDEQPVESKAETQQEEMTLEEQVAALQKQVKDLEKIKDDRGDFIERQNSVISNLQTKLDGLNKQKTALDKKTSSEGFWENPEEALKARDQKAKVEQQIEAASAELQYRQNKSAIVQVVPDYEDTVDDIVEYLKEVDPPREVEINGKKMTVGTTDETVSQFKKDPFVISAQKAIEFVNNARLFKKSQLYQQKAKVLEGKPRQILDKVTKAAQHKTATSSPSGTSESNSSDVTEADITSMSDADLQNFIKNAQKKVGR